MKPIKTKTPIGLLALLVLCVSGIVASPLGTAFTYQGRLDVGTNVANGNYDLKFSLYDAASGGTQIGTSITNTAVVVAGGLYCVTLDFGSDAFSGAARWLSMSVRSNGSGLDFTLLSPRQELIPTPYAQFAASAGSALTAASATNVVSGSVINASLAANAVTSDKITDGTITAADVATNTFWRLDGNAGTTPGTHFLGTTDNQPLEIKARNQRLIRLEPNTAGYGPNVIAGAPVNSVASGVLGATIGGGGGRNQFDFPSTNSVAANFGTVGGGFDNHIEPAAEYSTIGGGILNTVRSNAYRSTISGGDENSIGTNSSYSTIGGGLANGIADNSRYATIAGGYVNTNQSNAQYSTISGGNNNLVKASYATIPGGRNGVAQNYGQLAYASGQFAAPGDAQTSIYVVRRTTTDATQSELFLDGGASSARVIVPSNSTWSFDVLVTARTSSGASAGYQIRGVIENNAGSTALVGSLTTSVLAEDDSAWDATIVADDANNALEVKGTGAVSTTIRWVATIRTTEVSY